jgi:14-3-3 protein epsilon
MAADLVTMARCAERAERYDDMTDFMIQRVQLGVALAGDERDILSAAFKGALTGRRLAVNVALTHETKDEPAKAEIAAGYRSKVQVELKDLCDKVLTTLNNMCIPNAQPGEPRVFYLKMAGDYNRYMAEVEPDAVKKQEITANAQTHYSQAMAEAEATLASAHPVRLGLALNFSVFLHQVVGQHQAAVQIADAAYRQAIAELPQMPEDSRIDAQDTIGLLEQNLQLWRDSAC